MKKKVLILIAEKTGNGHLSSANAIRDSIYEKNENIEIVIYNAMKLLGKIGRKMENSYNRLSSKTPLIWKLTYELTNIFNKTTNYLIYRALKNRFKELVDNLKPDLIISVHPMFNNPVAKVIRKLELKIPFFVYIIDIVKISNLWLCKNADTTFCPTEKIKSKLIKKGFKSENVLTAGFPINKKFIKTIEFNEKEYFKPKVLMVAPAKNKKTLKFAEVLAATFNVNLTVIAGNNINLYNYLQKKLKKKNIKILGFIDDMHDKLSNSDILITKAGPNMMLEGVRMGVPVIIISHLLGQEEQNYKLVADNKYGLECESIKKLKRTFQNLEKNNYKQLNELRQNEINSKITDGTDAVSDYIINYIL